MINYRGSDKVRILAEMAMIFLIAAAAGITWNRQLIRQAWTGNAPGNSPPGTSASLFVNLPLPLGLLQVKELYERKEALIIDARGETDFASGHIEGAVSLPLAGIEKALPKFRRDVHLKQPLVVYCSGYDCHDSRDLAARLLAAGYRTVYVHEGGYPEWRDAGYPIVVGTR